MDKRKTKWTKLVILIVILAYTIMFVYTFFLRPIKTEALVYGLVEDKEVTVGYVTRNEEVIESSLQGEMKRLIQEGERVAANTKVGIMINATAQELENKISVTNEKINELSGSSSIIFSNDIKIIDNEINSLLDEMAKGNYYEQYSQFADNKNSINDKLTKRAKITGELSADGSAIKQYTAEIEGYKKQLNNLQSELIARNPGVVVYNVDGYEEVFSSQFLGNYTSQKLEELKIPMGEIVGTTKKNGFKIVDNIEGYITVVLESEKAKNVKIDESYYLRFPEISQDLVKARVEYMSIEDEKTVLTFKITTHIEQLINYRKLKVEVVWDSTEGLKISNSAIYKDGETDKVQVMLNKNYKEEKEIKILGSNSEYSIIESKDSDNKIRPYDEIIIQTNTSK